MGLGVGATLLLGKFHCSDDIAKWRVLTRAQLLPRRRHRDEIRVMKFALRCRWKGVGYVVHRPRAG
jgi:hypothetical protein